MLQLSEQFIDRPVLSLRTGTPVASTTAPIINPNNLKIVGFYCKVNRQRLPQVLLAQDIRQFSSDGYIVNDHDVLTDPDDLVRLKDVLSWQFELHDKPVYTLSGQHLGKIGNYAVDPESLYIIKLYVEQSLVKSFTGGALVIDRNQINEITPKKVIVEDLLSTAPAAELASS